ncbi:hypothetical protein NTHI1209_00604 [Haemophilus influenzae]|uniref:Uncharacterized protein n=1 Tax=Haemophilus influenzae TaxID=727 RepID=A0A158SVV7_HAEIF|nr:hypothetical protein NTHI1209_00604 [Haemophilus influenzae]
MTEGGYRNPLPPFGHLPPQAGEGKNKIISSTTH